MYVPFVPYVVMQPNFFLLLKSTPCKTLCRINKVSRRFVGMLGAKLQGVWDWRWNSERFIVFQTVILQRARHVTASHAIRRQIEKRLDAWGAGNHAMLVRDTLRSCEDYQTASWKAETAEHRAQTYHSLVLCGKLRLAVQWITEQDTGVVLQPGDRCEKTGDRVLEVLRAKHPEARTLTAASLTSYTGCPPDLTPVDITDDTVTAVAGRLSGGAGPRGTDSVSLQHWILQFGATSAELRLIVREFVEWLGNWRPPWDAYRALMSGRLIALDKQPGIRPVGVGETWRRFMVKCLLKVAGPEAKAACVTTQLAGGLVAGIEGAIHTMRVLFEEHREEENWGFLLIDARNAFNEENRTAKLWAVRHEWPSGAQ